MPNLTLELSESVYAALSAEAEANGLSVEAIATDRIMGTSGVSDDFFTPGILAEIDAARDEAQRGGALTIDEMRDELAARSRAWRESHLR